MIIKLDEPKQISKLTKSERQFKLALTSGCFDLLHPGHINYLLAMQQQVLNHCQRDEVKFLVVLHADAAITAHKGANRPIFKETERSLLIDNIKGIDLVGIWQGWESIVELVYQLEPDFLIGNARDIEQADWQDSWSKVARSIAAKLIAIPRPPDHYSTSSLIKQLTTGNN